MTDRAAFIMLVFSASLLLSGCSDARDFEATLYRNSIVDKSLRIHFATFDANGNGARYNIENCQMAARLLNSNVRAMSNAEARPAVGFWCEPGAYAEYGTVPFEFDAEYPTDTN